MRTRPAGALRGRATSSLHHGRVDSPRSFNEFLFAQLTVVVLIERVEHATGIGHPGRTARPGTHRGPALRPSRVSVVAVMSVVASMVMASRCGPLPTMTSVMVRPVGPPLTVSAALRSIRTVGRYDLGQCDDS